MHRERIDQAIHDFQQGKLTSVELSEKILQATVRSTGALTPDLDRRRRSGFPEVVYAEGKPIDALVDVIDQLVSHSAGEQSHEVLATRVSVEQARAVADRFALVRWNALARTIRIASQSLPRSADEIAAADPVPKVVVVSAGTTDAPVAEEVMETLSWAGVSAKLIQDIGVAGPYRLFAHLETLRNARVVIVVAGMEGALPSVVAGHVAVPVIAVPTSVGYGANFGGVSALLSMLNSCASNVAVVNIDAGFRGGYLAALMVSPRSSPAPGVNGLLPKMGSN